MKRILTPILICGAGRNGSTYLMELLGTDPRCYFIRTHPYEMRQLSYFAKFAAFWQEVNPAASDDIYYLESPLLMPCWPFDPRLMQPHELLRACWELFSSRVSETDGSMYYAEKAPLWLPPMVRTVGPSYTVYLYRDPRDVFLSTNAFMKKRQSLAFGREAGDSDVEHAIHLSWSTLLLHENYVDSRDRDDVQALRYEDLMTGPNAALEPLVRKTHVSLQFPAVSLRASAHGTAGTAADSVSRWKREGIADQVGSCFSSLLPDVLKDMGYDTGPFGARETLTWQFGAGTGVETRLRRMNDVEIENRSPESAVFNMTGNDTYVGLVHDPFDAAEVSEVWLCVRSYVGNHCSLYWRDRTSEFSEERVQHLKFDPGGQMQIVRFQPRKLPNWKGTIEELCVHVCNGLGTTGNTALVRWIKLVPARY